MKHSFCLLLVSWCCSKVCQLIWCCSKGQYKYFEHWWADSGEIWFCCWSWHCQSFSLCSPFTLLIQLWVGSLVIGYLLYHEQKKGYLYGCVILTCKVSNVQVVSFPARTRPDAAAGVCSLCHRACCRWSGTLVSLTLTQSACTSGRWCFAMYVGLASVRISLFLSLFLSLSVSLSVSQFAVWSLLPFLINL